jgi:hypothetical protein
VDPIRTLLLVVALPAAIAITVAVSARRWRHRGAIAVAGAAIAGAWATLGAPAIWPVVVTDRFAHLVIAGLVAAIAGAASRAGLITTAVAAIAAVAAVLGPLFAHKLAGVAGVVGVAVALVSLAAIGFGLRQAGRRDDRVGLVLAGLALAAASASAGLSGSVVIAQLGGAAAAGVGALWLVSWRSRGGLLESAAPVVAAVTWAVIAMAVLYASMSPLTAGLLIAAPLAGALPTARRAVPIALAAVLAGGAVLAALAPSLGDSGDSAEDYGYGYE